MSKDGLYNYDNGPSRLNKKFSDFYFPYFCLYSFKYFFQFLIYSWFCSYILKKNTKLKIIYKTIKTFFLFLFIK